MKRQVERMYSSKDEIEWVMPFTAALSLILNVSP